jgi:hypothetical protein
MLRHADTHRRRLAGHDEAKRVWAGADRAVLWTTGWWKARRDSTHAASLDEQHRTKGDQAKGREQMQREISHGYSLYAAGMGRNGRSNHIGLRRPPGPGAGRVIASHSL